MLDKKQRGKTVTTDRWVYGSYSVVDGYNVISEDGEPFIVRLLSVTDYSGLEDMNGINIYEGDIYKTSEGLIGIIVVKEGIWLFISEDKEIDLIKVNSFDKGQVIGNTYD